ncbi:carbohydrate kinase, partial [Burkholderia multivorans]
PIGAGDTFMVSLLPDLCSRTGEPAELDREELTRLGENAAGLAAITVSREGADLPWKREVRDT